jgi:hypothetical protein
MTSADDLSLLARLREAYAELDPLPPDVLGAARGALAWRTNDAELAELATDSLTESSVIRSAGPRLVSFEAESLTVQIEVSCTGGNRRLVGQLAPPGPARVSVRSARGEHTVEVDDLGRFTAEGIAPGPVSLLCRLPDSACRPIMTSWIAI